jgi:beta-lactamase class A
MWLATRILKFRLSLVYFFAVPPLCIFLYLQLRRPPFHPKILSELSFMPASAAIADDTVYIRSSMIRMKAGSLVRPLLIGEEKDSSMQLKILYDKINSILLDEKKRLMLRTASVYINDLDNGKWISINGKETYHPGSLLKVAVLIAYLKEAKNNPALLEETMVLPDDIRVVKQSYITDSIQPGIPYKIVDLLGYMITRSDNYATIMLTENMNKTVYQSVYTDLQLEVSDRHNMDYSISARDYSRFMTILYNGHYLGEAYSELALKLLSKSDFRQGLVSQLPASLMVAHKFGEKFYKNEHELHESGIVYCDNKAYLITMMTKGDDVENLAKAIGEVSKEAYNYFCPL